MRRLTWRWSINVVPWTKPYNSGSYSWSFSEMHVLPGSYETAGHLQSCTRIMHELGTRLCTCCMLPCFVLPRKHLLSLEWRMGSVTNFVLNESYKNIKKHNGAMSKNFLRHNFNGSFSLLWLLVVLLLLSLISLLLFLYNVFDRRQAWFFALRD